MNRRRTATLGIALALAGVATAASAAVEYREYVVEPTQVIRVERTAPDVIPYNERYVTYSTYESPRYVTTYESPRYVEVPPRETVIVQAAPINAPRYPRAGEWDPRNPEWGHLIDHGLFNRTGPTDFGR